ncbi:relaxase/mobilization nuclease domain-containing protein [Dysgonomonas sp. Marseille-P4677]|uniref:conjugal transfer protein MobB n=1 Tax=Dysgonomonas sp. Marseille-P4677 TaxID=2364790 RepID=UPI001912599B|nr:conjugal transfer protein MobB [Dysgonomonas sp. Marseille-P4677]MBK5720199.1 relaxase/mobilization nuclease domain-containing protein [Dysgonomonas sp. Marseille-P4677]
MVAKISKGNSLHGALSYNEEKVKEQQAKVIFSNHVMLNRDGSSNMYLASLSFAPYLDANKNTEKVISHISLNSHPDDIVSDEMYSDIAQTYMQKLGYGNQPYIVYKHEDLDRKHIHIVTVNIDENGKKIDDSFEKRRSKDITNELEKTYNLHHADKKKQSEDLPQLRRVDYQSGNVKKQIANTTKALIKSYRFQSVNEYRALLSLYGISVEEVKGEKNGRKYSGLVYSALDNKGEKVGNPIKASAIGKSVGYDALLSRLEYSAKYMKEHKVFKSPKAIIQSAIDNYTNRQGFLNTLAQNRISTVFRENQEGRIYGATFIDYQSKCVFNGSKMGKEFSANIFNELFKDEPQTKQQIVPDPINSSDKDASWQDDSIEKTEYENNWEEDYTIIPSLLEQHGTDYEAEAFAKRKEMEDKKRRRMRFKGF